MWIYFRNATSQVAVHFEYGSGLWLTIGRLIEVEGRVAGGEQYNLNFLLTPRAPEHDRNVTLVDFDVVAVDAVCVNGLSRWSGPPAMYLPAILVFLKN